MLIIPALWLVALCVVLLRQPRSDVSDLCATPDDAPSRLVQWAIGLLPEDGSEWGLAMVNELSYIEGRGQRWRFAAGCATSMLRPPWGRVTAPIVVLTLVAAGGGFIEIATTEHYGWVGGSQATIVVVIALLFGFWCAAIALLRRPGVAIPGLIGGLVVTVMWFAGMGYTFSDMVEGKSHSVWRLLAMLLVPAAVGAASSVWAGSPEIGKRAARLAAVSAGLATFLYGCLAVLVIGSGGGPGDPGASLAATISDRLGNQGIEFLLLLPTLTAVIGWAGAAAAGRLGVRSTTRPAAAVAVGAHVTQPLRRSLVLGAAVVGAILLVGATFLAG